MAMLTQILKTSTSCLYLLSSIIKIVLVIPTKTLMFRENMSTNVKKCIRLSYHCDYKDTNTSRAIIKCTVDIFVTNLSCYFELKLFRNKMLEKIF